MDLIGERGAYSGINETVSSNFFFFYGNPTI